MSWQIRADRERTRPMPGGRRRRHPVGVWTGPSADRIAEAFAESNRERAVRHVVALDHANSHAIAYHQPDLIGRPYWKISITSRQYKYLTAAALAARPVGYQPYYSGHLPKTGLYWWTDVLLIDGKWQAHVNVGHWTTPTDQGR